MTWCQQVWSHGIYRHRCERPANHPGPCQVYTASGLIRWCPLP